MLMSMDCAAGPADPQSAPGGTTDGSRLGKTGEQPKRSGLDNTPAGGHLARRNSTGWHVCLEEPFQEGRFQAEHLHIKPCPGDGAWRHAAGRDASGRTGYRA